MQQAERSAAPPATAEAPFDFDVVFRTNYQSIARAVVRLIGDPARAEDLAVEAFCRLWRRPAAHGEQSGGWVYRTAVRLALDELRRRARRQRYEQLFSAFRGTAPAADELFSAAEERGRVRAVLSRLSRRDAELLLLRNEDLSYADIADAVGLNPESVGTLLVRARQAFGKEYVRTYGQP